MAIQFINQDELKNKLGNGKQIVNFFAEWCGPCKMMAPGLEELSNKVEVFKIDIDNNRELATTLGIQAVPTTFIYEDGQVVDKIVGFSPVEIIEQKLQ